MDGNIRKDIYEQIGKNVTKKNTSLFFRLHVQLGLSETQKYGTHQSLEKHFQSKPSWTSERQQPHHSLSSCAIYPVSKTVLEVSCDPLCVSVQVRLVKWWP